MTFELKMTEQQAVDGLKGLYGSEITAADVRAFCAINDIGYQTVTKKLSKYKVSISLHILISIVLSKSLVKSLQILSISVAT